MPYRLEDVDVDHLEGCDERPAKRRRGEFGSALSERHDATVPVTWYVGV